jgi:hypothetical protein
VNQQSELAAAFAVTAKGAALQLETHLQANPPLIYSGKAVLVGQFPTRRRDRISQLPSVWLGLRRI